LQSPLASVGFYVTMAGGVLIVDDDPGFRRIARMLLEARGLVVAGEAADGEQARAACAERSPTALLLDVNLPDTNGPELASELIAAEPSLRILLTSTDPSVGPVDGVAAFVPKTELVAADLAQYLGG
jgi:two-component system nitrate/nitrite response regulator NarL